MPRCFCRRSDPASNRIRTRLARPYPHHSIERRDENLAVADLAGARGGDDGVDRALHRVVGDDHFDLHLWGAQLKGSE